MHKQTTQYCCKHINTLTQNTDFTTWSSQTSKDRNTHLTVLLHMATAMPKKLLGYYQIISLCKLYKNAKKKKKSLYVLLFHGIIDCKQFYEGKFTSLWCVCVCFPHNLRSSLTYWNRSHKQCCWSILVQFRLCAVYLSIYPAKCLCLVKLINSEEQLIL